ncbi:MAG: ribosome maturation factor RimM [Actinomycetaceae bacterium]|nr:ribosome maturation factor RimM [Actinomycetaceae bacterium]
MDVIVATVGSAFGLRGEVMLNLRTDSPDERIFPGARLRTDSSNLNNLTVDNVRVHKGRLAVKFVEIADRTEAEAIRGTNLLIDTREVEPEDDAWYRTDLIGLQAVDTHDRALGEVTGLTVGEAQDLLHVEYEGREVLVPFVYEIVPEVDIEGGFIVLDPPGGMFDGEVD